MNRNVCSGEGFWTPALCDGGGEGPGPASKSLPRRKPRGGRALEGATYGDLRVICGTAPCGHVRDAPHEAASPSELDLFGQCYRIVDFDTEVTDGAFDLRMSEK